MKALSPRLRHRITFQEQVTTRDSDGKQTVEWQNAWLDSNVELEDVPAEVLLGAGREFNASGSVQSDVAARITCRWFPGLKSAWRILWDGTFDSDGIYSGHIFNIGGVPETDATGRREWRIKATAGVNDGQ